ncbi:MAG: MvaI/BcnI family restriction endonuclease [Glaciecola sp.]|jgi:hypothetical protein
MTLKVGTYDTKAAQNASLADLTNAFARLGINNIYIKRLAPNDNSKNQPYFGAHLTDLPFLPTGDIESSASASKKTNNPKRQIKYQAKLDLCWIDIEGKSYPAPNSKLIYYPQYPEVRFSGFLKGSEVNISRWMDVNKEGRAEGRWLILGIADSKVFAYLVSPDSLLTSELARTKLTPTSTIFGMLNISSASVVTDTRDALLTKLLDVHQMGWIDGCKLGNDLNAHPYKAPNGGGYTLEAMLGIKPNGVAEPDFLGWEVKQFGVKDFPLKGAKPTTLMTPEPNDGFYKTQGVIPFMHRFGYPDKSGKPDRINFGGRHLANKVCAATNLCLEIQGFDVSTNRILDANGQLALVNASNETAASWSFAKLMDHWKKKHSQAVYVPCKMRKSKTTMQYLYGANIELGVGTTFEMFLAAMALGYVYYDPGIKLENASSPTPKTKRRSQFRINHKFLNTLYKNLDFIDLTTR